MAPSSTAPRRCADASVFRRDLLGPCFGHLALSVAGLLVAEKLCMGLLLPTWTSTFEALEASAGRPRFVACAASLISVAGFWGAGTIFALPALLRVGQWKIQVNRSLDVRALLRAMPLVALNFCIGTAATAASLLWLLPAESFDWSALPGVGRLLRDIVVWLLVEEVMFFYVHRWLHENKSLYAAIHKLHHTWTAPVSLVAIYCHPFEHIVSNIVPLLAGPLLCGSHVAAILVYLLLGLVHTTAVHSGYWFCDDHGMHDEHHAKFNVNYGVCGLMDSLYGTYRLPRGVAEVAAAGSDKRK